MNNWLTKADIDDAITVLKKNNVEPNTIKTVKEARLATQQDIFGAHWKKGDQYYNMYIANRNIAKRVQKILKLKI